LVEVECPVCGREGSKAFMFRDENNRGYGFEVIFSKLLVRGILHQSDSFSRFCKMDERKVQAEDIIREYLKMKRSMYVYVDFRGKPGELRFF